MIENDGIPSIQIPGKNNVNLKYLRKADVLKNLEQLGFNGDVEFLEGPSDLNRAVYEGRLFHFTSFRKGKGLSRRAFSI